MDAGERTTCLAPHPRGAFLWSGSADGWLSQLDAVSLAPRRRLHVHAGTVVAVQVHPLHPYVVTLGADEAAGVLRFDGERVERRHLVPLRPFAVENRGPGGPSRRAARGALLSVHPREPRFLARSAHGALCEIEFDERQWRLLWCRAYFGPGGAEDVHGCHYLDDGSALLVLGPGGLRVIDLARRDEPRLAWQEPRDRRGLLAAAALPPGNGAAWLVAGHGRRVTRVDPAAGRAPAEPGPLVARDDVLALAVVPGGEAFAGCADGEVVTLDPGTGARCRTLLRRPSEVRCLAPAPDAPDTLWILDADGWLARVNARDGSVVASAGTPRPGLLAAAQVAHGELAFAGRGSGLLRVHVAGDTPAKATRVSRLEPRWCDVGGEAHAHTRRLLHDPYRDGLWLARSDGELRFVDARGARVVTRLDAPLRDLELGEGGSALFAACDDGVTLALEPADGRPLAVYRGEDAFSALALNAQRGLLVAAERSGALCFLDARTLELRKRTAGPGRPRRLRWLDPQSLLVAFGPFLYCLRLDGRPIELCLPEQPGDILDFAWSEDRRYLAFCTEQRTLGLFELSTWTDLYNLTVDTEVPRGLAWLPHARHAGAYPYDLLVCCDGARLRTYRVHDNRYTYMGDVVHVPPQAAA
jgi:hypothetical protein